MPSHSTTAHLSEPSELFRQFVGLIECDVMITVSVEVFGPKTVWVDAIVVPSRHRGRGLGSQIVKCLTDEADRLGVVLQLQSAPVSDGNIDLDAWYARHGFVETLVDTGEGSIHALERQPKS